MVTESVVDVETGEVDPSSLVETSSSVRSSTGDTCCCDSTSCSCEAWHEESKAAEQTAETTTQRNNEVMPDVRMKSRDAPLHTHKVHDTIIETLPTKSAVGVLVIQDIFHSAETRDLQESPHAILESLSSSHPSHGQRP